MEDIFQTRVFSQTKTRQRKESCISYRQERLKKIALQNRDDGYIGTKTNELYHVEKHHLRDI